ncbi:lysophospholipid acyltransferase family protein [Sebaldella sp. S0638]|uniref:lysophospholipid acyltransferase family protein n=1 Tax=Sebaldella sp. S0638 TaxID=2957809 RepID=UPI00209DE4B3|nr:lipid A biosynthesis acyltransferase [Sebaldella sp. S0638]MCP1223443.1 lipid A biosynthesis acyltransferase [Sebaldella sp. S0638]
MNKYRIEVAMIKGIKKSLGIFSLRFRFKFAEFLGILAYYIIKKRRDLTYENLKIAFPEKSMSELKKIAKESYKTVAKNTFIPLFLTELIEKKAIEVDNLELAKELYGRGKGLILTTLHMGGFEAGFSLAKWFDVYTVFKKQKNPYLNDLMTSYRERTGAKTILKNIENGSNDKISECFRNKGLLILASDQYSNGVDMEFFGKHTKANEGNMLLAIKYKAPVILAYSVFKEDRVNITFVKELEVEKKGKLRETLQYNTQKLFYDFEELIRKYPGQYMWQHNRWKI